MARGTGGVEVEGLSDASTVLIAGPPMSGKSALMLRLLVSHTDRLIVVSTDDPADRVVEEVREAGFSAPDAEIGVVDCISHRSAVDDLAETDAVKFANSPGNLTEIGVRFVDLHESFYERDPEVPTGVGVDSVSQMIMHADTQRVYQFLHVLTSQVRSAGWMGAAVVDTAVVDDAGFDLLTQQFDGLIETRTGEDGRREFKARGLTPTASDWTPF